MNFIILLLSVLVVTIVDSVPLKDELLRRKAIDSARKLWDPNLGFLRVEYSANSRSTYPEETREATEFSKTPVTKSLEPSTIITTKYSTISTAGSPTTEVPPTTPRPSPPPPPRKPFIKVVFDYLLKFRFEFEVNKNR